MRAVQQNQFGGIEELFIGDVPIPEKKKGHVLVKVYASALNRADLLQRQGKYPPPKGESEILGLEIAGEIIEPDADGNWNKGDRVMALLAGGGQAEYVSAQHELLMPLPPTLSFVQAAAIPEVFLTAYQAMFYEGKLKEGSTVLIHAGASGVGTAAIQLAKKRNIKVFVTCSEPKRQACLDLGADLAIDYKSEAFDEVVLKETDDKGVDMVLDFIGGPNFNRNINALATGGQLIQIAMMGGPKATEVNLYPILRKHITIIGTTLRSRALSYKADLISSFYSDYIQPISVGEINPVIDSVYPLDDIQEAHRLMEANKNIGKIVLEIQKD